MPSAKSDERTKAEQIYHESKGSIKLVEIAARLGVSPSKVRKWKSLDGWDKKNTPPQAMKKKQVERSTSGKGNAPPDDVPQKPKKRGAPPGNKNAAGNPGGGAPERNKNNEKHGIYAQVFWDFLDEEEAQMREEMPKDEEQLLIEEIELLTIRERRLMKKIHQIQQAGAETRGLLINNVNRYEKKREFDGTDEEKIAAREDYSQRIQEKVESGDRLPGREVQISTTTVENSDLILRAHAELTRVQSQKTRCIEALSKIRQNKDGAKGNSLAEDWIKALTGGDEDVGYE